MTAEINIYDISTDAPDEIKSVTITDVRESIETNMWLAEAYYAQGATALGRECLASAWREYHGYEEIIDVACGRNLGNKLRAMVMQFDESIIREGRQ